MTSAYVGYVVDMAHRYETIEDYIATFPEDVQTVLRALRETIQSALPDAREAISYDIPTFTLHGRNVIHFAAWKHHVSVYPIPDSDPNLVREVAAYRASRGTVKFPLGEPVPYDLVGRLARGLAAERANQ